MRVAREVADAVTDVVRDGGKPLVVGGDCTIIGRRDEPDSGRCYPDVGLAYVDGDADLGSGG